MGLLSRREHGARELKAKLIRRGIDEADAVQAVDELAKAGWQSDLRYAQTVVRTRAAQGYGLLRVRQELAQAGIDRTTLDAALVAEAVDWDEVARAVWLRRCGVPGDARERARQFRFMAGRGFSAEQVRKASGHDPDEP